MGYNKSGEVMKRFIFIILLLLGICLIIYKLEIRSKVMLDLTNKELSFIKEYSQKQGLELIIKRSYHPSIPKDYLIKQSIKPKTKFKKGSRLTVTISLGINMKELYQQYHVNELGQVPIMMYHGIIDLKNEETFGYGGNVDQEGYNRTQEAFRLDLEKYYQEGYRMIRLKDYINGVINVELGKSPLILTFDDGNNNNIKVLGKDEIGELIIDPNSAVGILEYYKKKYPDFQVTATFFLNEGLFQQPQYNYDLLKWLVANDYDIGNHTKGHLNLGTATIEQVQSSIASLYQQLDQIIPNQYVNILSLPFGAPLTKTHPNFSYILKGNTNSYVYENKATLRVGWEPELSPFHHHFDQTFLKRVRAWDNKGQDFDLEMCFKILENTRYISDGDPNTIVIKTELEDKVNPAFQKQIITY